jgi:NAD(P)H-nitrite reductase large subunit
MPYLPWLLGLFLMDACFTRSDCTGCPGRVICHCLQVTEEALLGALATLELRSVNDVREATGAGAGCMACHRRLRLLLERHVGAAELAPSLAR